MLERLLSLSPIYTHTYESNLFCVYRAQCCNTLDRHIDYERITWGYLRPIYTHKHSGSQKKQHTKYKCKKTYQPPNNTWRILADSPWLRFIFCDTRINKYIDIRKTDLVNHISLSLLTYI